VGYTHRQSDTTINYFERKKMSQRNTRRWIFTALWCIAGAGTIVLLAAAINKKNSKPCSNVTIQISGVRNHYFMDEQDVLKLINDHNGGTITGKPVDGINLRKLEELLRRNIWVKDAELFIDNQQVLHVNIAEREPVARIFTKGGNSFYIDSSGVVLPLSDKLVARLPVFTNFPAERQPYNTADSTLADQLRQLGTAIVRDSFWLAQTAQIDITPQRSFEMVPVIGNHIIELGDGTDAAQKLHRLFVFYQSVLAKTGFDKYSRINVQYAGQVIGTRRGTEVKVDSLLANRAVQELANMPMPTPVQVDTLRNTADTLTRTTPAQPAAAPARQTTQPATTPATRPGNTPRTNPTSTQNRPPSNPGRTGNQPKPKPKPAQQRPRAVMRPTNEY
jgi:cell division protein FtsQ